MQGFITDAELPAADQEFPGISEFFATLVDKPRTFLELVARYEHWCDQQHPRRAPAQVIAAT
jgi:hypothetical protein